MKKLIFSFLAFWSLSVSAQTTSFSVVSDPNNPSNPVDCNCYLFSVTDPTIMPFYDPQHPDYPDNPGFSYLWVWGDGTHTFATEASTSHCFDGNIDSYNIEMHFTPRKRPREPRPSSIALTNFNGIILPDLDDPFETCSTPPISGTTGLSVGRDLKDGEDLPLIVEALSCSNNSIFTVTYDNTKVDLITLPANMVIVPHLTTPSQFAFIQDGGEFNCYYVDFRVKDASLITIPVDAEFTIQRDEYEVIELPGKDSISYAPPNPDCHSDDTLSETITSGPYDPNVIQASHGENLENCNIAGDTITYVLQFENEGADVTSEFVKVNLMLDENFNPATFKILRIWNKDDNNWPERDLSLEQEYYYEISSQNGHEILINCHKMELASRTSESLSDRKGFIEFSVEVNQNFDLQTDGPMVTMANVIFDFEPPMPTNDAITSCAVSDPDTCSDCKPCCCKECCCEDDNYWKYIFGVLGAIVLAFLARFFMKRSKP